MHGAGFCAVKSLLLCWMLCLPALATEMPASVTMCIDHYPPFQVIGANGEVTGENIEVTKAVFQRLGIALHYTRDTPLKRCLMMLDLGLADVMTGLLDTPERRQSLHMMLYSDAIDKSIYIRKGARNIERFSDLENLTIGIMRGAKQFRLLDNAPQGFFKVEELSSLELAFKMLVRGRVDVVSSTNYSADLAIKKLGFSELIEKASYEISDRSPTYISISKKSPLSNNIQSVSAVVEDMYSSGEFVRILSEFQQRNPQWYR